MPQAYYFLFLSFIFQNMSAMLPTQGTSYINILVLTVVFIHFGFSGVMWVLVSN